MNLDMSYPGISFGYHSWALGAYLDSLEKFIGIAKDQYRTRAMHELKKRKNEFEPGEYYQQKLNEVDEAEPGGCQNRRSALVLSPLLVALGG